MTRRRALIAVGVVAVLALLGVTLGPLVYERFVVGEQPGELTLPELTAPPTDPTATALGLDGAWRVGTGSVAGYRVDEVLFGRDVTVVGRTEEVTGGMTVAGPVVRGVQVTVDMASVQTDEGSRDAQYRDRIMSTSTYPTATFVQTAEVTVPATTGQFTVPITGDLTVRGQTRPVTVDLDVQVGAEIVIVGSIDVVFADFGIPEPSLGGITVDDHGVIEFLLRLTR